MTSTFTTPNTTELMVSVITTQSYPEIIINTISFSYSMVTLTNNVWSVVNFELISIITIYLGGSDCGKICK